jgi:sulfoxide reductase heme-binding subunit YedZ
MKLWRPIADHLPWDMPWSWRGELGIWFTILSVAHVYLVVSERQPSSVFRLADYLGMVALFWALVLTATSFGKVIKFIGVKSWKWLHSFAYVLFYLAGAHILNHAFLRTGRPDSWIHWAYAGMIGMVFVLQLSGFVREIALYRKSLKVIPE